MELSEGEKSEEGGDRGRVARREGVADGKEGDDVEEAESKADEVEVGDGGQGDKFVEKSGWRGKNEGADKGAWHYTREVDVVKGLDGGPRLVEKIEGGLDVEAFFYLLKFSDKKWGLQVVSREHRRNLREWRWQRCNRSGYGPW
eukprot:GFKZ01013599.1.p3 GENE.GFKZ01013599.1~~GFKZ01013599.1.p3  ORF type:complete len:144 (-),score=31.78 GFKZ01013599.1:74-505(-)